MSKLVLVADAPWVVNEVKAALAGEPWQFVEVSDPEKAVETVESSLPDAVLVDLQVGSMGGMAVTRAIRQSDEHRPRIVMLLDRHADTFLARRAGADAAVVKPIDGFELRFALSGEPAPADEEDAAAEEE
jgi:DNA-binding response OmpR family regulator